MYTNFLQEMSYIGRYGEVSSKGECELGPKNDVLYGKVSTIRCQLNRGFVMSLTVISSVSEKSVCWGVRYKGVCCEEVLLYYQKLSNKLSKDTFKGNCYWSNPKKYFSSKKDSLHSSFNIQKQICHWFLFEKWHF